MLTGARADERLTLSQQGVAMGRGWPGGLTFFFCSGDRKAQVGQFQGSSTQEIVPLALFLTQEIVPTRAFLSPPCDISRIFFDQSP